MIKLMTCETCAKVVSEQRDEASLHGLSKTEIDCGMSAFEHEDLRLASGGL